LRRGDSGEGDARRQSPFRHSGSPRSGESGIYNHRLLN
jgi:hypothetical protein